MSYFDAFVGIGGTYATVAEALADNKHNICVLSNTVEVNPWIFGSGETQVTLFPTAIILYNGTDPLIQTNAIDNFYILINNGSMVIGSDFITSTPLNVNSAVKFSYVNLNLTAFQSSFASSNLYIYDCNISTNATYLTTYDGTNVVFSNNTVFGNIFLSNQSYSNITVKIDTNLLYSTLAIYPNEALSGASFKDLYDKAVKQENIKACIKGSKNIVKKSNGRVGAAVGYPAVYTITNNKIGVLSLATDATTASYFAGLTIVNNEITSMNAVGNTSINLIFSTFSNNTIEETNMANSEFNSWTNVLISTISNNTFLGPLRLGDLLYTTISDNLFDALEIGSTDPNVGSITLSKVNDNIIASLIINLGINVKTEFDGNIIGSDLSVLGAMGSCVIQYNTLGNFIFNGLMKYNVLNDNYVSSITYNQPVDSDIITEHLNLTLNLNNTVNNLTFRDNVNAIVIANNLVTNSKFLANYNTSMKFVGKVSGSIFMNNNGSLGFKEKVYTTQVAYNNQITIKFHKAIIRSIVNFNILKAKLQDNEECDSIVCCNL
jgi:hypothetical protein